MTASPGIAELFTDDAIGPALSFGDDEQGGKHGMRFDATMTPPVGQSASALFVQLINKDNELALSPSGVPTCVGPPNAPALDHEYPYPNFISSLATSDSPEDPLDGEDGELQRRFSATMYVMWMGAGTPCNPDASSDCNIPIPYGYITWNFNGDAINTLQSQNVPNMNVPTTNNTTWILNCGGCTNAPLTYVPTKLTDPSYVSSMEFTIDTLYRVDVTDPFLAAKATGSCTRFSSET